MRHIKIVVGDEEFEGLEKLKGDLSWEDFILMAILKAKPKLKKVGRKAGKKKDERTTIHKKSN